jgi:hypothetical protein
LDFFHVFWLSCFVQEFEPKYIGSPVLALIPRDGDKFSQCNAALLASLEALALPLVNGNPESKPFKVGLLNPIILTVLCSKYPSTYELVDLQLLVYSFIIR